MLNKSKAPIWYIYGAGGLGLETADILLESIANGVNSEHQIVFLVDSPANEFENGIPIVGFESCIEGSKVTIAVGEPDIRKKLAAKAIDKGLELASIISCRAYVSNSAVIGAGSIIAPFSSVQSLACIGKNVSVNTQAIIGHHVVVDDNAVISSQVNLGGSSRVGSSSYVGMGALILEKINIGQWSVIGMGSVVYKDVPDEVVALGNPARVARKNEDKKVFK
ncbi:NeuD/PglB/VioB family sugar acetyltransferase [Neptuniibacter sp. SY11_33]|uniref:NeuD/PglB/VioB family sugar acetyltransferase n=1 Tax=Neptuniibacter sp. SY11_33 TaxID=3398215 RepID=UPI0039F4DE09